jgi:PleD family two-component response regulator
MQDAQAKSVRDPASDSSTELELVGSQPLGFEKAKVLLVDDSRLLRMGLRRSLEEIGLTDIVEAGDGREAIETLVREHFDLMLLDMEMPEMNGMEVLAVLRDTPHHPWPPVIVISGGTAIDDAVRCIELGAEDYLSKPFNPVLLRARVKTSLERKQLRDQEVMRMRQLKRQHEALAKEQGKDRATAAQHPAVQDRAAPEGRRRAHRRRLSQCECVVCRHGGLYGHVTHHDAVGPGGGAGRPVLAL